MSVVVSSIVLWVYVLGNVGNGVGGQVGCSAVLKAQQMFLGR